MGAWTGYLLVGSGLVAFWALSACSPRATACAPCNCSESSSPPEPSAAVAIPTSSATAAEAAPGSQPAAPEPEQAGSRSTPADDEAARQKVAETCERICVRTQANCTAEAALTCRTQCQTYVAKSKGCETEFQRALECQAQAQDAAVCSRVAAPSCLEQFRDMKRCERGEPPPQAPKPEIPAGWERRADDELGLSVLLPSSATLDPAAPRRTWHAEVGRIHYYLALLEPPPKELTHPALIRVVLGYVSYKCQKKLRIHGRYDSPEETGFRFDTGCNNGTEWHGMIRIWPGKAVVTAYHASAELAGQAVGDPFFYSVERKK